jgi:pyruvate formate lyase activating enzyme
MIIGAMQKTSLIDYPGEIATVLFTQGCNFRCPYCHNPELVDCNRYRKPVEEQDVLNYLEFRKNLIDGVVITGGEPTIHQDLPEFIKIVKDIGYLVKLDTNGTNPEMLREIIDLDLVDYIAMDYKAPLRKYSEIVRSKVDINDILESVEIIKKSSVKYEFRTTIVKQLLSLTDIDIIKTEIGSGEKYCIQEFNPTKTLDEEFLKCSTFSSENIEGLFNLSKGLFEEEIFR